MWHNNVTQRIVTMWRNWPARKTRHAVMSTCTYGACWQVHTCTCTHLQPTAATLVRHDRSAYVLAQPVRIDWFLSLRPLQCHRQIAQFMLYGPHRSCQGLLHVEGSPIKTRYIGTVQYVGPRFVSVCRRVTRRGVRQSPTSGFRSIPNGRVIVTSGGVYGQCSLQANPLFSRCLAVIGAHKSCV